MTLNNHHLLQFSSPHVWVLSMPEVTGRVFIFLLMEIKKSIHFEG